MPRTCCSSLLLPGLAAVAVFTIGHRATRAADPALAISASSIHSEQYQPEYAVDGKPDTRWASQQKPFGSMISVSGRG